MERKQPSCLGFLGFVGGALVFFFAVGAGCLYLTFHSDQRDLTELETATVTDQWTGARTKGGNDQYVDYSYEYAGVT